MNTIIQINVTANWGSTGRIANSCNDYASESSWICYNVYGRDYIANSHKSFKISSTFSVYVHYLQDLLFDNEGLSSEMATKRLINFIKEINPTIVHLHNIHDHWLNYKILFEYLNKTDIKIVWTFHDFWAVTGHCYHFVQVNCLQFMSECVDCPYTKGKILPLVKRTKRNYDLKRELLTANHNLHIVSVSDWVGENVAKSFLRDKDLRVINNGVDTDVFRPTKFHDVSESFGWFLEAINGKFVIMAVSSQWKSGSKGLDDYLAMADMLKDDEVIVLVGLPEEMSKGIHKNIIGIQRTNNQQELAALYTCANVVCSFSSAETFGLTIVEGYACGTPAVVYDNTAHPSLITPNTGFVVENHNYRMAYSAIQQIKINGKQCYTEACITLARDEYNKDKCFKKYVELYEELLDDNKSQKIKK